TWLVRPGRPASCADPNARVVGRPERRHRLAVGAVTPTYLERLAARTAAVGSVLCLGLDPDPARLPAGFSADVAGVERFVVLVIEAAGPFAAARSGERR